MESINKYLEKSGKKIGVICSFDKNENEYDHQFYLCADGKADDMAWELDIRKMENVSTWQVSTEEAKELGLKSLHDLYNYSA